MTQNHALLAIASAVALGAGAANAATTFVNNGTSGSIYAATNWSSGQPGTGNNATINVTGAIIPNGNPQLFAGTYSITSTVDISTVDEFNLRILTVGSALTWNMTAGTISARYFSFNGPNGTGSVTFNMSGGNLTTTGNTSGVANFVGVQNNGVFYISESAVIDASATLSAAVSTTGTIDIASGWSGYWSYGAYTGTQWRDHFVNSQIKYNGSFIDGATFDSTFSVTNGGTTLQLIPEPGSLALLSLGGLSLVCRRRRA